MAADKVKITEVIKELEFEANDLDSVLQGTPRHSLIYHLNRGWKDLMLGGKLSGYVRSTDLELQDGWYLTLPNDYVRYVKISGVTENGQLVPLFIDNSISVSNSYLLDHNDIPLLDAEGQPLKGLGEGRGNVNAEETNSDNSWVNGCGVGKYGRQRYLETGAKSIFGQYKIDKENDVIVIADSPFESFVLYYIPDETTYTDFSSIEVEKIYGEVLKNYVFWKITSRRRNVTLYDKQYLEKEYRRSLKDAQLKSSPTLQEWRQYGTRGIE